MPSKRRAIPEINAGSMADIAFLLLIFFLVTTTMDAATGISVKLPPPVEDTSIPDVKKKNVLEVLVNANNQLLVEGELTNITDLRRITKKFLTNYGKDPKSSDSPKKAIVSLKNDRGTNYNVYIQIQNELKAAYREVRAEYALNKFGRKLDQLNKKQADEVKNEFPQKISEAEPEDRGE